MQLVVLTHVHFDHAKNAERIAKHFNIPVAFHKADIELFDSFDKSCKENYFGIVAGFGLK